MQSEATRKLQDLTTLAHREAVLNLKDTTKDVIKDNLRIAEALKLHLEHGQELIKSNAALTAANRIMSDNQSLHNLVVKEKIQQAKQQEYEVCSF